MFYISRIRLVDVKCFPGEVEIDLSRPSQGNPSWTLILGDNGTGKTSLLRSIALCLCDETRASGLLTELSGNIIRNGCTKAEIELQLASETEPSATYTITTTFRKNDSVTEDLSQTIQPENGFRRAKVFACGYGAAFGTIGSEVYEQYRLIDAVYSLFNYTARLQNPENALFRISREEGVELDQLLKRMDRVLMLPVGSTALDSSGLRVGGPWGDYVPAGALGDGYAATLAWICDLLGWSLLATRKEFDGRVQGIVLLDEMEKHLHPSWQRAIVGLLAREFPGVQFIATTHAPLTVIGAASLPDNCCQLVLLQRHLDGVKVQAGLNPPRGRRADQVLTSYLFGLPSTTSDDVIQNIERYAELKRKPSPDASERKDIERLQESLNRTLGTPETELQQTVEEAVRKTLSAMAAPQDSDALSLETRRQIRELFDVEG